MNPEQPSVSGESGSFANEGWEALVNYDSKNNETTARSVIESAAGGIATGAASLIEGWNTRRKQNAADLVNLQNENLEKEEKQKGGYKEEALAKYRDVEELNLAASKDKNYWSNTEEETKKQLDNLRSAHSVGNYVSSQIDQVGNILEANASVVKSAVGAFAARFIAKLPHIEISVRSAEDNVSESWNDQQRKFGAERSSAKTKVETAQKKTKEFADAKSERAEKISGLASNRDNWRAGREAISATRQDLNDARKNLANAKKYSEIIDADFSRAEKRRDEAYDQYNACLHELEDAHDKKEKANKEVAESQRLLNEIEAIRKFQEVIGTKSPSIMRHNIESELKDLEQKKTAWRNLLIGAMGAATGNFDFESFSESAQKFIEKSLEEEYGNQINSLKSQIAALDQYEELRRSKVNRVANVSVVKKSVAGVIKKITNRLVV